MPTPVIRPRAEHNISRQNIDPDALKVLYRLRNGGYTAYLVGGGVRDMLLGRTPKDFDIGTDAHPNDIKKLFRNARLIGRRFRLAHVVFGNKVIEVSTFRKKSEYESADPADVLVRRDNTFGTPDEDAVRRDFTVNGLFYDIATFSVIDYVGGLEDLDARLIRAIGDPQLRFREDPIRMLRAIKFAARLGMEIEPGAREALLAERWEIPKAAPPRILEEILRTLRGGAARKSYQLMRELGVLEVILPRFEQFLASTEDNVFVERMRFWELLETLDAMRAGGRDYPPAVLVGCLVLPILRAQAEARGLDLESPSIVDELLEPIVTEVRLPRRDSERLRLMTLMQGRLARGPSARGGRGVRGRSAFAEALDLFELYCAAGGEGLEVVEEWRALAANEPAAAEAPPAKRRRRRRRRRTRGEEDVPGTEGTPDA